MVKCSRGGTTPSPELLSIRASGAGACSDVARGARGLGMIDGQLGLATTAERCLVIELDREG